MRFLLLKFEVTAQVLTVVTDDVAEMVLALLFSAALVVALPHWVGASEMWRGKIR